MNRSLELTGYNSNYQHEFLTTTPRFGFGLPQVQGTESDTPVGKFESNLDFPRPPLFEQNKRDRPGSSTCARGPAFAMSFLRPSSDSDKSSISNLQQLDQTYEINANSRLDRQWVCRFPVLSSTFYSRGLLVSTSVQK